MFFFSLVHSETSMKKAPFPPIAMSSLVMLKISTMIFLQLLTKEFNSQKSQAEHSQRSVEVSVTRVAMGRLRNILWRLEKYFLPPVPPAKLETPNTLNMELKK